MPTRLLAALVALLLLVLVACDTDGSEAPPEDEATPPEAIESTDLPDGVAASVNGGEIPVQALEERVEIARGNPEIQDDLERDRETTEQVITARSLSGLIMRRVVVDGARTLGIEADEEDVAFARSQLEEAVGGGDAFAEHMAATGIADDQLEEELNALALLHLIGEHLTDEVTEDDELDEEERADEVVRRSRTWLAEQLATAEVVVDEVYGRWDPASGQVVPPVVDEGQEP